MDNAVFASALTRLWPHGNAIVPGLIEGIIAAAPTAFSKWGFVTDVSICQAMAEFSEECGAGTEMQENMNYSAPRLLQVFPSHFTPAQAMAMQHQPRLIADQAYGSRMGNRPGTDDGYDKRGKGLSQLTGEENYAALSKLTGYDLINHPDILIAPATALDCGLADMVMCGCLPYALKDNLVAVASLLNEGHFDGNPAHINGFNMRQQWLTMWKHAVGVQ